ncbi:hypothetical protein VNO77_21450 [Canavalia gladiata]|uniref:Secreted protein n=1 Tax=Canavalia gladiata TaxID=3824 RepID=A0AAN9LRE5_CANGL
MCYFFYVFQQLCCIFAVHAWCLMQNCPSSWCLFSFHILTKFPLAPWIHVISVQELNFLISLPYTFVIWEHSSKSQTRLVQPENRLKLAVAFVSHLCKVSSHNQPMPCHCNNAFIASSCHWCNYLKPYPLSSAAYPIRVP